MLEWKEPPPSRRSGPGRTAGLLMPLLAHPKRWALIDTRRQNPATNQYKIAAARLGGRWEIVSRANHPHGYDVYARYLGDDDEGGDGDAVG